jgi:AcrR family transcriptional regulator
MTNLTELDRSPDKNPARAADRILSAARDLFYRLGIRAVGVDEIVTHAGATKPSLYRSFGSKDELTEQYLKAVEARLWSFFDAAVAGHPGDPRSQILSFLSGLSQRAASRGYRGCGLTNAAIEYPESGHPVRLIPVASKKELRRRLRGMAMEMGAASPDALSDGLLLLIEGAYASVHLFGTEGPARSLVENARRLIQSHLAR